MVMSAFAYLCNKHNLEVLSEIPIRHKWSEQQYRDILDECDVVIVNGEGTIHHAAKRGRILTLIAKEFNSVLVNAVYDHNPPEWKDDLKYFKYISCRESISANQIREMGLQCDITPDLTFTFSEKIKLIEPPSEGRKSIGRIGSVVGCKDYYSPHKENLSVRAETDVFFSNANIYAQIITGRFHGICGAAMLGIPFSAWQSNSCKNEGIMTDMGISEYYSPDLAIKILPPETIPPSVQQYINCAPKKIDDMFHEICQICNP